MLEASRRPELLEELRPAARQALNDFAAMIDRYRARAQDASVDELLRELIAEIRYGEHLKAEGPEGAERLENVGELFDGAAEVVVDEGGELGLRPLDHFLQRASLIADVDRDDPNADAVYADDAAQRERAGVSDRVHHRPRGGVVPTVPRA